MKTCTGLYTALITPFKVGKLDVDALKVVLEHQMQSNVNGIVLLGSTGEAPTLTLGEKKTILRLSRQIVPHLPLIAGVGSPSTQISIEYTQMAVDEGIDALLIVTPYYNKPMQNGIIAHFEEIARSTILPIIVYNHLGRTGTNIAIDTLKRLSEIPQIIGVKETSANLLQITETIHELKTKRKDFSVLSGDDPNTFSLISLGGDGVISTASNVFPQKMSEFVHACQTDLKLARELHYQLLPLFKILSIETNPIPIKAAMANMHLSTAEVRLPLTNLSEDHQKELALILRRYS